MSTALALHTKWNNPYKWNGKDYATALPNVHNGCKCSGVYLIKNRAGEIIYVGHSQSDLYKTIFRHFQTWNDRQQPRKVYGKTGYTIRVIFTTKQRAVLLEKVLIDKYKPRDNNDIYEVKPIEKAQAKRILNTVKYIGVYEDPPF